MNDEKVQDIYETQLINPNKQIKPKSLIKIQYVNQDLNEAINEMKQSVKKKSLIYNQGHTKKGSFQCPQSNPESASKLYFTETYKKKYEYKLKELQEKKKILTAKSLQKQMKARLAKKIKENTDLNQKMKLLQDLQQKKQQLLTEQSNRAKKKEQEKKFLHECSMDKFSMLRKHKNRASLNDLKDSRVIDQESRKEHMFKVYMDEKQKQEHQMLLRTKLEFSMKKPDVIKRILKSSNLSQRSLKSSFKDAKNSRQIFTSQGPRKQKLRIKPEQNQDAITQLYLKKGSEESMNMIEQKKYNKSARTPKSTPQNHTESNNQKGDSNHKMENQIYNDSKDDNKDDKKDDNKDDKKDDKKDDNKDEIRNDNKDEIRGNNKDEIRGDNKDEIRGDTKDENKEQKGDKKGGAQ